MDELIRIRKQLHAQPELSGKEEKTSQLIAEYLERVGIKKIYRQISHHSLIAEITANNPGPVVLFRCELDALPIEELNHIDYRSQVTGVSHACGHDGNMSIMLGFAYELLKQPPEKGRILLLFQSAEETGQGAQTLLDSGFLKNYDIDSAFALHIMPGYNQGAIICKAGNFTPAVESLSIELIGKTSHAAEPEKGINPARSVANIITFISSIEEPDKDSHNYFLATPIQIQMGEEAFGTSAGHAIITYTFRAWDNSYLKRKKHDIEDRVHEIIKEQTGIEVRLSWSESFKANINHPEACSLIKKAASINDFSYIDKQEPLTWGEDFGLFTEVYKGAMFGIGAGTNYPALHNPDYDFPDELIQPGIKMFMTIADQILNPNN